MKLLVAGSRDIRNRLTVYRDLDRWLLSCSPPDEIVSGMALHWLWKTDPEIGGPDRYAYDWATANGIVFRGFPADWSKGLGAGMARNAEMADYADYALVYWDGASTGSKDMYEQMKKRKKYVELDTPGSLDFE